MERAALKELLRDTGCARECGDFVFLQDPSWSEAERRAAELLMRDAAKMPADDGWLCIRTGGSSGAIKFARHDEHTIAAAVAGFMGHFRLERVNTVGVLPPWHVSGLMARVRCAAAHDAYVSCDWKALERGEFPALNAPGEWVVSLVPTQLQRLLGLPEAAHWLRQFSIVFLGGGPAWKQLTDAAAAEDLPISQGYGMTETAAMATGQRPIEFLEGDRSAGTPLDHASIELDVDGRIVVRGESIFRGYFPDHRGEREFLTEDLGRIDEEGRLHVLGRRDAVIITGGKKVDPAEVEAALRASGELGDVVVVGVADSEWGEIVVACYPAGVRIPDEQKAVAQLAPHQRPKRFVPLADWPRNAQGKINRAAIAELLKR